MYCMHSAIYFNVNQNRIFRVLSFVTIVDFISFLSLCQSLEPLQPTQREDENRYQLNGGCDDTVYWQGHATDDNIAFVVRE